MLLANRLEMQGCLQTPQTWADELAGRRARLLRRSGRIASSPEHDLKAFAASCAAPISRFRASDIGTSRLGFSWPQLKMFT